MCGVWSAVDLFPRGMCECEWSSSGELIGGLSGWPHNCGLVSNRLSRRS